MKEHDFSRAKKLNQINRALQDVEKLQIL